MRNSDGVGSRWRRTIDQARLHNEALHLTARFRAPQVNAMALCAHSFRVPLGLITH
jgi:hypothetical protein